MQPVLTENLEAITKLCRQHEEPGISSDYEAHGALKEKLVELFCGPVDLIRAGTVRNPYIRQAIETEQQTVYAA